MTGIKSPRSTSVDLEYTSFELGAQNDHSTQYSDQSCTFSYLISLALLQLKSITAAAGNGVPAVRYRSAADEGA